MKIIEILAIIIALFFFIAFWAFLLPLSIRTNEFGYPFIGSLIAANGLGIGTIVYYILQYRNNKKNK